MIPFEIKYYLPLAIPFVLIPSTVFIFVSLVKWLGKEKGYLLGFIFYWTIWCLIVPIFVLGKAGFLSLFMDVTPLLSRPNQLVAVLFI